MAGWVLFDRRSADRVEGTARFLTKCANIVSSKCRFSDEMSEKSSITYFAGIQPGCRAPGGTQFALSCGGDVDADRSAIMVLVTTSTQEEAERIGRLLVEAKLAACANVVSGVRSIFRWDNNISVEQESLMIIKTTRNRFAELESMVRQQHSYSVPEIVALPVVAGSESYLNWVRSETDK